MQRNHGLVLFVFAVALGTLLVSMLPVMAGEPVASPAGSPATLTLSHIIDLPLVAKNAGPVSVAESDFITVSLGLSETAVLTNSTVHLHWQLLPGAASVPLLVTAQEPGNVYSTTGALSAQPGSQPATGRVFYLRPNLTWTLSNTVYMNPGTDGSVALSLPSGTEGEWRFSVLARDPGSPAILSGDARSLLASNRPAMLLRLNRPIANGTDRMRATLITTAGSPTHTINLVAWLIKSDHTQLALPSLLPGLEYVYQGPSANAEYSLLDRHLSPLGVGDYRVEARMYDAGNGKLLALADAGFSVCDAPNSSVSGIVYNSNSQPLGGNHPTLASVQAFDVDDGGVSASTTLSPTGAYTLSLSPGRYLLSANVVDAAGWHKAQSQSLLVAGCSGASFVRNLTAAPPLAVAATSSQTTPRADGGGPRPLTPSTDAPDGLPQPEVMVVFKTQNASIDTAGILTEVFIYELAKAPPENVYLTQQSAFAAALRIASLKQGLGEPDELDLQNLAASLGKEFVIQLDFRSDPLPQKVVMKLVDTKTGANITAMESVVPANAQFNPSVMDPLANYLAAGASDPNAHSFFGLLRAHQDYPRLPYLTLEIAPASVRMTETLAMTATLREKDAGGALQPNQPITLIWRPPHSSIQTVSGQTGADGTFRHVVPVGTIEGFAPVQAQYFRRGALLAKATKDYYVEGPAGNLALRAQDIEISFNLDDAIITTFKQSGVPQAGKVITLSAQDGSLNMPTVTTDANGQAAATFTAGSTSGIGGVSAQVSVPASAAAQPSAVSDVLSVTLPLVVDGGVSFTFNAQPTTLYDNGVSELTAEVLVGGARVPALPVAFSVQGAGGLDQANGQTDANGQAIINYLAPASGTGSATVTAVATVDDHSYTLTTVINYAPLSGGCAPPAGKVYCVTEIAPLPGLTSTEARGINHSGQVVGSSAGHAFIWYRGVITDLGTLSSPGSLAYGINDASQVVGMAELNVGNPAAFIWQNGAMTQLAPLAVTAYAINNSGQSVGYGYSSPTETNAYIWQNGAGTLLGTVQKGGHTKAWGINNTGQVVGSDFSDELGREHAFLWQNGAIGDLGTFGGLNAAALAINSTGQIAGSVGYANGITNPFIMHDGTISYLSNLGGNVSIARAINDSTEVVGGSDIADHTTSHAWVWQNGTLSDLNDLIDSSSGWTLEIAYAINDVGQIVGDGHHNGASRAFLLSKAGQ